MKINKKFSTLWKWTMNKPLEWKRAQDEYRWATCNTIFAMKKLVEKTFPERTHWALVKLNVAKCSEIEMK